MKTKNIGYLYINGLIDSRIKFVDRFVHWWWGRAGIDIQLAKVNWFDNTKIADRINLIVDKVSQMLKKHDGVALIGSSAGGSLVINAFDTLKDKNVCAILAHSRLKVGKYQNYQKLSLYHSARIGKKISAPSFYESVQIAQEKSVPNLSVIDKKRILTMTQITDGVVPIESMTIDGVKSYQSFAFGHRMGFIAHIIIGRDIIIKFTNKCLID